MKALIIDDEQHCIDRLNNLLVRAGDSVKVVGSATDVDMAHQLIKNVKPDVIFLDVQINDATGFELLQRLTRIDFDVVFTTAFEQYATRAFKFAAIDYLLKPIDYDDLLETLNRIVRKNRENATPPDFTSFFENFLYNQQQPKKIAIPTMKGLEFLDVQEIVRCKSDINYTTLFLRNKQTLVVAKTLKDFESLLLPYNFFRVHNSHLINLAYIKNYSKGKGGYVLLQDNTEIEVSTRRKEAFLSKLSTL